MIITKKNRRIIKDSRRSIAIESELKPGYLGVEVEPIKISETKKSYIILETRLISSIYPESNALFSLSHVFTSSGSVKLDGTAQQVLQVIQRLPPSLCLSFFPAILNCLMKILVCGCDEIASLSVICLITVLKKYFFSSLIPFLIFYHFFYFISNSKNIPFFSPASLSSLTT